MANLKSANVIVIDTTATALPEATNIIGVRYAGASNGTAEILGDATKTNGSKIWEQSGSSIVYEQIKIRDTKGVYVNVTNNAKVYLYLK